MITWLRSLFRRDHEPRLWPVALVDVTTRVRTYELGYYDARMGVRTRW